MSDAYCKNCGYIVDERVTNSETCDECHTPVEYHTADDQDTITQLRTELAEAQAVVDRLPKTADGVVVYEERKIWFIVDGEVVEGAAGIPLFAGYPDTNLGCICQPHTGVSEAYSTPEAAEAAREGGE